MTATGEVSAGVVETLSIISQQPLTFGHVTPLAGGGTVTIGTDNTRSVTGAVEVRAGGFHRAAFHVQGAPGRTYSIHMPDSQLFISSEANANPNLVNTLTVDHFTVYSVNHAAPGPAGQLGGTGADTVYLGGTLLVPENAMPGTYSGLVPLTVSY